MPEYNGSHAPIVDLDTFARVQTLLSAEWQRLVQAYVADALPLGLLKAGQDRITRELAEADSLLNAGSAAQTLVLDNLEVALELLQDPQAAYRTAATADRRLWNQAVYDRILVDTPDSPLRSEVTEIIGHLLGEAVVEEAEGETKNPGPVSRDRGSKEGLPRESVTSDLWCREVPLEGCSPCPSPIPVSSART